MCQRYRPRPRFNEKFEPGLTLCELIGFATHVRALRSASLESPKGRRRAVADIRCIPRREFIIGSATSAHRSRMSRSKIEPSSLYLSTSVRSMV